MSYQETIQLPFELTNIEKMKLILTKFIHGDPKAQPRVKAVSFAGRARVYTPTTAKSWKSAVAKSLQEHAGKEIKDALRVNLSFFFKRPKSHFGTGKNADIMKDSAPKFHTIKPDKDNLEKAVFDVLSASKTGIGLWHDDAQVVIGETSKSYADLTPPGMCITIYSMERSAS